MEMNALALTSWADSSVLPGTVNSSLAPVQMESHDNHDFYFGLFLAMSSSIFIGSSFILKKKGLLRIQVRAGQGGFGYLKEWMWWGGMSLMAIGECANFTAYAFAPATLVTPLGALSVLVSAVLASYLLKERLNLLGKLGCLVCILGSTVVVIHSPKEQDLHTMDELAAKLADPGFLCYAVMVILSAIFLIFYCAPRWGLTNPLIYITITGTIGSLTVMGCKGLGVALKQTMAGQNQFTQWLTWLVLFGLVMSITVQMNYLNKALDVYNTSVVTPMLYVVFTTFVIIASSILFKEWGKLGGLDIMGNICGFITIVSGIFLLQGFKDLDISLHHLPKVKREILAIATSSGTTNNGDLTTFSRLDESNVRLMEEIESQTSQTLTSNGKAQDSNEMVV